MEIIALPVIAVAIFLLFNLHQKVGEIDAKLAIVIRNSSINWHQYYTKEIISKIKDGHLEKAAMLLRAETGLPFNECMVVVKSNQAPNA